MRSEGGSRPAEGFAGKSARSRAAATAPGAGLAWRPEGLKASSPLRRRIAADEAARSHLGTGLDRSNQCNLISASVALLHAGHANPHTAPVIQCGSGEPDRSWPNLSTAKSRPLDRLALSNIAWRQPRRSHYGAEFPLRVNGKFEYYRRTNHCIVLPELWLAMPAETSPGLQPRRCTSRAAHAFASQATCIRAMSMFRHGRS